MRFILLRLSTWGLWSCLLLGVCCAAVCSISRVQAAEELPIYRVLGTTKSQADSERNAAASIHFGEVIVRATGRRDALMNPVIQAAIPKASSYLFSFSYTGSKTEMIEGKPQNRIGIQLDYSPQAINQLLKKAQLPLWPSQRPTILLWTAYRDNSVDLQRVPDELAMSQLQSQTYLRGLKIKLPELDLEDNIALSAHDIWQVNLQKIKHASQRYKPDVIVVARYQPASRGAIPPARIFDDNSEDAVGALDTVQPARTSPAVTADTANADAEALMPAGPWVVEWQIIDATGQQEWRDQTKETTELVTNFVNKLADYLATQFSITLGQQTAQTYYMQINHIRNFAAMKKSQAYLKSLALVQKCELIRVNEQGLLLALTIEGDSRLLASTLLLGKRLLPEFTPQVGDGSAPTSEISAAVADVPAIDASQSLEAPANFSSTDMSGPRGTLDDPLRYIWQED
jgi:uncharacterized protein